MTRITRGKGRWLLALPLAVAATVIGAVFGTAQSGQAASKVAPNNTTPPVVTGAAKVGSTLTTTDGAWTGTTPQTFTYAWRRCDTDGGSCSTISGATAKTYDLKAVDAGNTLRSVVTSTNTDGNNSATSVPTAVVAAADVAPATGCPSGTGVIPIEELTSPANLSLDQQSINPTVITRSTQSIQVHYRVTACGGRPVQGALVYLTAVPFNQFSIAPEAASGADGTVNITETQLAGFPASSKMQQLTMFVRARKPSEGLTGGGVSFRLLIAFPVQLK